MVDTITVRKFGHVIPLASAPCEGCGETLLYNFGGSEIMRHEDESSTCQNPWPGPVAE